MTRSLHGPLRVGVGGPVGSGKTALVDRLCKHMRDTYRLAVVTNDIYTKEDAQFLTRIPAFPVTTSQLARYNLQYLNTEKVDEVDCYIFQVSPKTLDRQHPLFDGVMWVDQKYLEVVKTYGKWVTDLGPLEPPTLPFDMFETYRENVDGKYWFPNYSRAEGIYKMKDRDVPIRVTIKWFNFKPFPPAPPTAIPSATSSGTPPATPSPASKP